MRYDKTPLASKKFLAFLLAEVGWFVALGYLIAVEDLRDWHVAAVATALILVGGFVQTGYILGQASLDRYVRLAQIAARSTSQTPPEDEGEKPS